MRMLSLDLGRHTGYALWSIGSHDRVNIVDSGEINLERIPLPEAYAAFYTLISNLITESYVSVIAYECVEFVQYRYSAQVQYGLEALLLTIATQRDLTVMPQGVTKIKRAICGNGRAKKSDVIREVMKALKRNGIAKNSLTDHEADAIACGLLTIQELKAEHEP